MRPLRLVVQAVGPFADRQTIDFRSAIDCGLFGIYGATGSGKSTIFSAMTFALFGKLAKDEQRAPTLRSDHAEASLLSEVDLVFEAAERTYRVVRQPEQVRPAKRGGGETKQAQKAWLFDVTGIDLDEVGSTRPGKVVAEGKVEAADREIEKVLGYGLDQFRQIVLLPQGRFETFLSASTDERVAILRDLFDVSLYRRLTEDLKERARAVEEEIRFKREVCRRQLADVGVETAEGLAEAIEDAKLKFGDKAVAAEQARIAAETAKKAYESAASTDKAFAEHLAAEQAVAAIANEASMIEEEQRRLKGARAAQALELAAQGVEAARNEAATAMGRIEAAKQTLSEAATAAKTAGAKLEALAVQSEEIEALRERIGVHEAHARTLVDCEGLRAQVLEAQATAAEAASGVKAAEGLYADCLRRQAAATERLETARRANERRLAMQVRQHETARALAAATAFAEAERECEAARAELSAWASRLAAARQAREAAEDRFRKAEATLLSSEALHLAARLETGAPCPVCGSTDHPRPARGRSGGGRPADAYEQARSAIDAARAEETEAEIQHKVAVARAQRAEQALEAQARPVRSAADVKLELDDLERGIKAIGPEADVGKLGDAVTAASDKAAAALVDVEAARVKAAGADNEIVVRRERLAEALRSIPEPLRAAGALDAALRDIRRRIKNHEAALDEARARERGAGERSIAGERDLLNAQLGHEEAAARFERATKAFLAGLETHGLTAEDVESHRRDVSVIPTIEARIRDFGERRAVEGERLRRAAAAIEAVDRPDIVALAAAREAATTAHKEANGAMAETRAWLSQLETLRERMQAELSRLDRLETESAPMREVAGAVSGNGPTRMDLETFAIAAMFDRVLEAANVRLHPMTQGRYSLVREQEGSGRARRGLGISVDDTFTGRRRPTSTLSGGETFMAALSLALGLSDVVESARGSIRLDTIFIDEGFGSLDSDSEAGTLEQVLQTLQDLVGRSRAVGIISHVPLVQQAIPNGFWITKTSSGSHIEERP